MNPNNEPTNPNPPSPLAPDSSPASIVEALLKRPASLVATLQQTRSARIAACLIVAALFALAAYGLVVGSFSGGRQMRHRRANHRVHRGDAHERGRRTMPLASQIVGEHADADDVVRAGEAGQFRGGDHEWSTLMV